MKRYAPFLPEYASPLYKRNDWLVYTDAASTPPCLFSLLSDPLSDVINPDNLLVASARHRSFLFKDTCLIFFLELLAMTAFFVDLGPRMAGESIWIYMDNNFLSAVTGGDSNTETIAILVGRMWGTLQRYRIFAWFPSVPSKLNPADRPARGRKSPCTPRRKASSKSILFLYRRVIAKLKNFNFRPQMGAEIRIKPGQAQRFRLY